MTQTVEEGGRRVERDPVTIEQRIAGGLLGVHAGDALGATHEFLPWTRIHRPDDPAWRQRDIVGGGHFGWRPGDATDDTDLTLAVLRAYTQPAHSDVTRAAADGMLAWYRSGPKDVGGATARGLLRYQHTGDPRRAGAGPGQAGNGSLMRCLPTGLARTDAQQRARDSAEISAVTHDDPQCTASCVAYNDLVAALLDGSSPGEAVGRTDARGAVGEAIGKGATLDLATLAADGGNPFGPSGYVLHSLTLAVAAVLDPRPFPDVLADVVHLGGDTDTNGAIAGGLLGVRDGVDAIPAEWRAPLQHRQEMEDAVPRLVTLRGG